MTIYFAPMEGVTDGILRQTHNRIFGGIDVYCLPFHKLTQSLSLLTREIRDTAPEENEGLTYSAAKAEFTSLWKKTLPLSQELIDEYKTHLYYTTYSAANQPDHTADAGVSSLDLRSRSLHRRVLLLCKSHDRENTAAADERW